MQAVILSVFVVFLYFSIFYWNKIKQIEKDNHENLEENQEYKNLKNQKNGAILICAISIIAYAIIYCTWTQIALILGFIFFSCAAYDSHKKIEEIETGNPENIDENQEYKKLKNVKKIAIGFCVAAVLCFLFDSSGDEKTIKEIIKIDAQHDYDKYYSWDLDFNEIKVSGDKAEVLYTVNIKDATVKGKFKVYVLLKKHDRGWKITSERWVDD